MHACMQFDVYLSDHADELHSKSKNCPYDGALLYGKIVTTIKGGKVTFQIEE